MQVRSSLELKKAVSAHVASNLVLNKNVELFSFLRSASIRHIGPFARFGSMDGMVMFNNIIKNKFIN